MNKLLERLIPSSLRERGGRLVARYRHWARPNADGLPRAVVLFAFPLLVAVFGIVAVALTINGTSSGAYYTTIYAGSDPALLAGHPELIRSDEWNVSTSWSISQVQQGLPEINRTFPGGMDASIPHDLPRRDWSVAFRPQLMGYLVLDVNHATAIRWWAPALALLMAAYAFAVTVLPRRPILSAMLAVGFFASPFFQWWFQSSTFWPPVWGLVAMTAIIWAVRSRNRWARWGWAAAAGYFTTVMAMGIYAPFIIPVVVVVGVFGVFTCGRAVAERRSARPIIRFLPLLVAGGLGGAITLVWLRSKQNVVDAFLGTDYPGERLFPTGTGSALGLMRTISSPFSEALSNHAGFLGTNSSEASTFFLVGAFLILPSVWLVVRRIRGRAMLPWELIGLFAAIGVFAAFSYVPHWDGLSHILFLDRSTADRMRIGLGLASFAIVPWFVRELEQERSAPGRVQSVVTALLFLVPQIGLAIALVRYSGVGDLAHDSPFWWAFAGGSALSLYLFSRRVTIAAGVAFLLVTVLSTVTVNPVYLGVLDLRKTAVSKEIVSLDRAEPGRWVGMGSTLPTSMLLESGVGAYNGVQGAPSRTMWKQIDPTGKYEYEWNRLGTVNWLPGTGAPVVTNPSGDQIFGTFDACAAFAQKHVKYVLSDAEGVDSRCLNRVKVFRLAHDTLTVYEVVPVS